MDKILFLDIDGVFIPRRAYFMAHQSKPIVSEFDPCVVGMVNDICKRTGAKLVIHSSWLRSSLSFLSHKFDGQDPTVKNWMVRQGLKEEYFHEDCEAKWRMSGHRWLAIADWLTDHEGQVEDYRILEDEHMLPGYVVPSKVVQTAFDEGLLTEHYTAICIDFGVPKEIFNVG